MPEKEKNQKIRVVKKESPEDEPGVGGSLDNNDFTLGRYYDMQFLNNKAAPLIIRVLKSLRKSGPQIYFRVYHPEAPQQIVFCLAFFCRWH